MRDFLLAARTVFRGDIESEMPKKEGYHKTMDWKDANVCLTCTREKCYGAGRCFRERKREMEKEAAR